MSIGVLGLSTKRRLHKQQLSILNTKLKMSQCPPRLFQQRFIQRLQSAETAATDIWEYAVSRQWVEDLQQTLEDDSQLCIQVLPMSVSDVDDDNMYIGESTWKVLASWYSVNRQYSFRRRRSTNSYIGVRSAHGNEQEQYILCDNKLDFLTIYFYFNNQETLSSMDVFFWDTLCYIEFQLRCGLKLHPEKDVRMWLALKDDGTEVVLENIGGYDRNISFGAVLCEKFPQLILALQTRMQLPTANLPHVIPNETPVRQSLSSLFSENQWSLTVYLESLHPTSGVRSFNRNVPPLTSVPEVMHNMLLDHLFEDDAEGKDWDKELKVLLDNWKRDFGNSIQEHRDKVQERVEHLLKAARQNYHSLEEQFKAQMKKLTLKEGQLDMREKEMNERDHELNSKLAKFKSMLTEFLTSKATFEKNCALLKEQNAITASKVELNVGGECFTTSLSTLLKEKGSRLQVMFEGQHGLKPDENGSYFIDRDGTHFRHVLNFLRDGVSSLEHLPHKDLRFMSELRTEAEYYQLHSMAETLRIRMAEGRADGDCASLPTY